MVYLTPAEQDKVNQILSGVPQDAKDTAARHQAEWNCYVQAGNPKDTKEFELLTKLADTSMAILQHHTLEEAKKLGLHDTRQMAEPKLLLHEVAALTALGSDKPACEVNKMVAREGPRKFTLNRAPSA